MLARRLGCVGSLLFVLVASGCRQDEANEPETESESSETSLPCTRIRHSLITHGGPGRPSPEEAVAPFADGLTLFSEGTNTSPRIYGVDNDGTVVRDFKVSKTAGGWITDGWDDCGP